MMAWLHKCFPRTCAQDSPFFTVKLGVKVLPCIVLFSDGVAVDRTVGFDEFGATDDFSTAAVERRLLRRSAQIGFRGVKPGQTP